MVHLRLASSPVVPVACRHGKEDREGWCHRVRRKVSPVGVASPVVDDSPDAGHRSIREVFLYPEEGYLMEVERDDRVDRRSHLTYGVSCSSLG